MKHDTAGDPMSGLKWTRKTLKKISAQLKRLRIYVSPNTTGRLLKKLKYSLRVNHKTRESGNQLPPSRLIRDQQFNFIAHLRKRFAKEKNPIISVDCKKKELIGNFKNNGTSWEQKPYEVNDHDFYRLAEGIAIPYGIYDTMTNQGFVMLGTNHETPALAVDAIVLWWRTSGRVIYPNATKLLIIADCGGGNSARSRIWKYRLYHKLCIPYGLGVTVAHYPPGASKWNPIEHRLFSEITKNWAGKPLRTFETALKFIRTTTTTTGLRVQAVFSSRLYPKGEKVSDTDMQSLPLRSHRTLPSWNYTLSPSR